MCRQLCGLVALGVILACAERAAGSTFSVTSTVPARAANGVMPDANITAYFQTNLNSSTISSSTFKAWGRVSGIHTGAFTLATTNFAILDPTADFAPGEEVLVMLSTNIRSTGAASLKAYSYPFHVGVMDCPLDSTVYAGSPMNCRKTTAAWGCRVADLNTDGLADVICVVSSNINHIAYLNRGDGTFSTNTLNFASDADDVDVGDLNGDGKADLFIVNFAPAACQVYTNSGNGTFGLRQSLGPTNEITFCVRLADLDGDGDLDAFVTVFGGSSRVYLNDGTGLFTTNQFLSINKAFGVDLGDLDGDGDIDAFVTGVATGQDAVLFNNGLGLFTTNQLMGATNSDHIRLGDLDGDGDLNAFAANGGGACRVYVNNGSGVFTTNQLLGAANFDGVALGDLNGDGSLDAYVGVLTNNDVVFLNNGNATFVTNQTLSQGNSRSVDLGDFDRDGDLDVFCATAGIVSNRVWYNDPPAPTLTPVFLAPGTPVITSPASPGPNNVGDNFDLDTSGGAALMVNRCGFGNLGSIFFNYDATNLYLGAYGVNVGGTNNGLVLFLGLNTLTNNATNLLLASGSPFGLSKSGNLRFTPPVDVAIILGDEFGDSNAPSFNLAGGQDLGQGVYILTTGSFTMVTNARVSQFDGTGKSATVSTNDDADRQTERWEISIPWTNLNATDAGSVTSLYVSGVLVGTTNGGGRYLSANYLGSNVTCVGSAVDYSTNFAYATVTVFGASMKLPNVDTDGDGMPNGYELTYGFNPTNAGDANLDTDGDSYSNLAEYIAGTAPNDSGSYFIVSAILNNPESVQFQSLTGRVYIIQYEDGLLNTNGWQILSNNVTGVGGTMTVADPGNVTGRQYRVNVRLGP